MIWAVRVQAFKKETILSTSWNQSLVAHETRQPLICISNETVCYSCWGEKKWSLYRTWFLGGNFAFHSMTPAQPVYHTCSSQALVQKLLGRCSKQQNNTGEKLTSTCDHRAQFSCKRAGGRTQKKTGVFHCSLASYIKMIAQQAVRHLDLFSVTETTYCTNCISKLWLQSSHC